MRFVKLMLLRIVPWTTRYFHVGERGADRIEIGLATLIRKRRGLHSYLFLWGGKTEKTPTCEFVPETDFFWGPWVRSNMGATAPMKREIDELEAFVLIRRAHYSQKATCTK